MIHKTTRLWYNVVMRLCSFVGCSTRHKAKGYCDNHYRKFQRWGDPFARSSHIRHGGRYTPEYRAWLHMKQRCTNPKRREYPNYGGRGITVCEEWANDYRVFLKDMGKRPTPQHSLDRKDNSGNYEPSNCRWATPIEQNLNQRLRKDNISGYRGVYGRSGEASKKWAVQVRHDGIPVNVGVFTDLLEAAYVRDQVILQLHGTDAKLNLELV